MVDAYNPKWERKRQVDFLSEQNSHPRQLGKSHAVREPGSKGKKKVGGSSLAPTCTQRHMYTQYTYAPTQN